MGHPGDVREKVAMAVMVPLNVSNDYAVHRDSIRIWKNFAPDIKVDWVPMAQRDLRYNVVIVGKFFNKGNWALRGMEKRTPGRV